MKVAIHQPNFFPYPGFFHKLTLADTFVIMDNTQYDKKFTNRNKIVLPNNWTWFQVPINKNHKFSVNSLVEINNNISWKNKHLKMLHHSYSNSKYYQIIEPLFQNLYSKDWKMLFDLTYESLKQTLNFLNIKIKILKESELNISGKSSERLINICKNIGADVYVSGIGGKNYMDEKLFAKNNVNIEYQNYSSIVYEQHQTTKFIPDLSIIDLLFNLGRDSLKAITKES